MDRARSLLFRFRGGVMAVLAVYALIYANPTTEGLQFGFAWALLGEGLRLWAIGYSGQPTRGENLEAPQLITAGPYAYVRNPLYVGNLLNSLGVLLAAFYPWDLARILGLWVMSVLLYRVLVSHEENFLAGLFGEDYLRYQKMVPAWVPNGHGYAFAQGQFEASRCWQFERTSLMWWSLIWLWLAVKGCIYGA